MERSQKHEAGFTVSLRERGNMDKIALIADIHGNLPALKAVQADIQERGADKIYCLGDMSGRGPSGAAVLDWCRENCEVILLGNWEDFYIRYPENPKAKRYLSELGRERFEYMHSLPFTKSFWMSGRRVQLFHGRPIHPKLVFEDSTDEEKLEMFSSVKDDIKPDVVGFADIHRQYQTDFALDTRLLFNTGSVGHSYSAADAKYVIINGFTDALEASAFSTELISVPYDVEEAVHIALAAGSWYDSREFVKDITRGIAGCG